MSLATPQNSISAHRFTTERYHRLIDSGALIEDDRVELLNGIIVDMSPIGTRHAAAVRRLNRYLSPLQHNQRAVLGVQDPILLDDWSEPQPDLWLAIYRPDFYENDHPTVKGLLLVIEVADSSLEKDTQLKIPLYANANIPEVWLVDVNTNTVFVHRNPGGGQYKDIQTYKRPNDRFAPLAFPDATLAIANLFPSDSIQK